MKETEAIEAIKANYPPENYALLREALDLAVNALKKQIPTKPIKKSWTPTRCPSCGESLSEDCNDGYYKDTESMKICDCGQRLDWT